MKTSLNFSVALLLGFAALSCSDLGTNEPYPSPHPMPPLTPLQKSIVNSGNTFGVNLFREINATTQGQNLLISPLSVSMALGMTLNGARGSTQDAMEQTLGFAGLGSDEINASYAGLIGGLTNLDPTVTTEIGNSIWYRPTLEVEQAFKDVNVTYFNAQVRSVNFSDPSASGIINDWVSNATHGKIPSIVPNPIASDIVMYLINAIYFKGVWTRQFDPGATHTGSFTLSGGSQVPCQMMNIEDTVAHFSDNGLIGVDLPYGSAGFSMTIFLPPAGTDIDEFIAGITAEHLAAWTMRLGTSEVRLFMPKFKLSYRAMLNDPLSDLGMGIAFSDGADFTGIDRRGSLAISEVLHKTFIQVDEEGTEAAAVTSVAVGTTSVGGGIPVIMLDRPFVYLIREHVSGVILFIGKLAEPAW